MPSSSGAVHHSFRSAPHLHLLRGVRGRLVWLPAALCAVLSSVASASVTGCDTSESRSPFVLKEQDAGADGAVEGGTTPVLVLEAGPRPVAPGEWGGPCLDDGQCADSIDCTTDACDLDRHQCHFSPDHAMC